MDDDEKKMKLARRLSRSETHATIIEFVDAVKEAIGIERIDTDWEADIKAYFGVDETKLVSIETEFPIYQQSQACYATNKFLEEKTKIIKIIDYEGEDYSAPNYSEIEVKRNKTIPLMTRAWVFTKWRKTKLLVHVLFDGNYREFNVFGLKKHEKIIHKFSTEVKKCMRENNLFRGERLEYNPLGRLAFLDYNQNLDWDAVILPKDLKDEIILNILFPLSNEKLCKKHNISWRRGVLLAGMAGTGKTQLARVLLNMLGKEITVIWCTPKAIHDPEKVKLLFEASRYFSPSLLVIEDIDFIGKSRDYETDPIVGELLTQLDGNAPNHGVFVLATTNRAELLDRALLERPSRFDVKLVFEIPDRDHRLKMIEYFAVGKKFRDVTYDDIADMTHGFTGAYIQEVITYGTLLSLQEKNGFIEERHLKRAIKTIKGKMKTNKMVA